MDDKKQCPFRAALKDKLCQGEKCALYVQVGWKGSGGIVPLLDCALAAVARRS